VATPPATYAGRRVLLLESDAAPLFMRHLERMLEERGFINLTDVSEPEGPIFSQYRKDDAFLSLALEPPREERQELVIEFEGAPWEQLVSDAVHNAARDLVDGIVSAIDQTPAESGPSAQRH
jgi:hypothetical protein